MKLFTCWKSKHSETDMAPVKELVDKIIAENKVAVFSKSYCPYCKMAKAALREAGSSNFFVLELDERNDGDEIQAYLHQLTGGRTVPRVFISGKFVGGGTEVKELQAKGLLKGMVQ